MTADSCSTTRNDPAAVVVGTPSKNDQRCKSALTWRKSSLMVWTVVSFGSFLRVVYPGA
jgi:hypothetical protein